MSATAVSAAASLRNDLAAFRHHLLARLRIVAHDPLALGILAFAGVVTVPLWGYRLGLTPLFAGRYPWPGGVVAYNGPTPTAFQLAFFVPDLTLVVSQLLWAALVAGTLGSVSALRRSTVSGGRAVPALPVGPRARLVADVLAVTFVLLLARTVVLCLGGRRLGEILFGQSVWLAFYPEVARLVVALLPNPWSPGHQPALLAFAYASSFVVNTVLGTLLVFPLVLAWSTIARLDWRGLRKPAAAAATVFAALGVGAMGQLLSAIPLCVAVSAFLLVRLDDGSRTDSQSGAHALQFRSSIGPLRQFRRDAWLNPLRGSWRWLAVALGVPFVLTVLRTTNGFGYVPERTTAHAMLRNLAGTAVLTQWLALMALALLPFGIALMPATSRPGSLFGGAFLRSWSALPVRPANVVRAVYVHALLAGAFAWLVLLAQSRFFGVPPKAVAFELPLVLLVAGIAVCETVGDRRRGLLAVAGLVGFQFGFMLVALAEELTDFRLPGLPGSRTVWLFAISYPVALVGILPPLVHLHRRAPRSVSAKHTA